MAEGDKNKNGEAPTFTVLTQYLKDLSFENPNAPNALRARDKMPEIQTSIDVKIAALGPDNYDVVLFLTAKAGEGKEMLFHIELAYGGVFFAKNIPQEHLMPLLSIECPRLLFPFARQIVADATRNGGFPPLMIDPVDFVGLFQKRVAEEQAKVAANKTQA